MGTEAETLVMGELNRTGNRAYCRFLKEGERVLRLSSFLRGTQSCSPSVLLSTVHLTEGKVMAWGGGGSVGIVWGGSW